MRELTVTSGVRVKKFFELQMHRAPAALQNTHFLLCLVSIRIKYFNCISTITHSLSVSGVIWGFIHPSACSYFNHSLKKADDSPTSVALYIKLDTLLQLLSSVMISYVRSWLEAVVTKRTQLLLTAHVSWLVFFRPLCLRRISTHKINPHRLQKLCCLNASRCIRGWGGGAPNWLCQ